MFTEYPKLRMYVPSEDKIQIVEHILMKYPHHRYPHVYNAEHIFMCDQPQCEEIGRVTVKDWEFQRKDPNLELWHWTQNKLEEEENMRRWATGREKIKKNNKRKWEGVEDECCKYKKPRWLRKGLHMTITEPVYCTCKKCRFVF